jgi:bacteriorhodopsin
VRYIDWTITTPLLLLELLLNTGLPLSDIVTVIFMDLVMIITGLVGALVVSRYKWAYFAFGCAALLYIWWILLFKGRAAARTLGNDVHRAYTGSTIFLMTVWLLYPIAWGLSDGGNRISPLGEMIFYGSQSLPSTSYLTSSHTSRSPRYPRQARVLLLPRVRAPRNSVRTVHAQQRQGLDWLRRARRWC